MNVHNAKEEPDTCNTVKKQDSVKATAPSTGITHLKEPYTVTYSKKEGNLGLVSK